VLKERTGLMRAQLERTRELMNAHVRDCPVSNYESGALFKSSSSVPLWPNRLTAQEIPRLLCLGKLLQEVRMHAETTFSSWF
jgi:hypothetical protein